LEIRAAQQSVAAKSQFVRTVDLDDILLTSDSVHFDSAGLQVVGQRLADAYLAIVLEQPPGEFNRDGIVDAADYVVWRKIDGTLEGYEAWRTNFGGSLSSGAAAYGHRHSGPVASAQQLSGLPEPSTFVALLAASQSLAFRRVRLGRQRIG
jgi:hypothetical protein